MKKIAFITSTMFLFATSAYANQSKRHVGGTIISVSSIVKSEPLQAKKTLKRDLFDYGVDEKGISKSQKEYREFLSAGSYSKLRSIGTSAYANMGGGSSGGGPIRGRAIYGRPFNTPSTLSTGGFASIRSRRAGSVGSLGGRRGGFATLGGRRR